MKDFCSGILLNQLHLGYNSAYRQLFENLQPGLVAYANEYLLDVEISKEIVQEAFLKLWENRAKIKDDFNVGAYLFRTVRNYSLNHLRHLKVRDQYKGFKEQQFQELALNFHALSDVSAEKLLEEEILQRLQVAIEKMPPQCKKIFCLSRFEEKSYKEIAEELSISVKTVENQINKALKIARVELKEYLPVSLLVSSLFV